MVEKEGGLPCPQASLGIVSSGEGLKRSDGKNAGEMPRGCPACNREEGRSSASLTLRADLPLEQEGDVDAAKKKAAIRVAIDYCPCCGRVYDVRCGAAS